MQRSSLAISCAVACVALFAGTVPARHDPHKPSAVFAPRIIAAPAPEAALTTSNPAAAPAPDNFVVGEAGTSTAEGAPPIRKPTSLERARAALAESNAEALSDPELCTTLLKVARSNDLPLGFFTNLIWRESRFDHDAISPVGAMGIAQFMPDVAEKLSLDAFDSRSALPASGRLLRTLHARFGNLGLAAAAYNAGPKRVSDWLEGRSGLPKETQDYVHIVTGRPAAHWVKQQAVVYRVPRYVPCHRLPSFASAEQAERMQQEQVVAEELRRAELARLAEQKAREAARRKIAEKAKPKVVARWARVQLASRAQATKSAGVRSPMVIRVAQVKR
jgi:soluble lytic murein transglycosylase-like protein